MAVSGSSVSRTRPYQLIGLHLKLQRVCGPKRLKPKVFTVWSVWTQHADPSSRAVVKKQLTGKLENTHSQALLLKSDITGWLGMSFRIFKKKVSPSDTNVQLGEF